MGKVTILPETVGMRISSPKSCYQVHLGAERDRGREGGTIASLIGFSTPLDVWGRATCVGVWVEQIDYCLSCLRLDTCLLTSSSSAGVWLYVLGGRFRRTGLAKQWHLSGAKNLFVSFCACVG